MIMGWTGAHSVFAVETFFKIGESVISKQRDVHSYFMLHWNDAALDKKINSAMGWKFYPE